MLFRANIAAGVCSYTADGGDRDHRAVWWTCERCNLHSSAFTYCAVCIAHCHRSCGGAAPGSTQHHKQQNGGKPYFSSCRCDTDCDGKVAPGAARTAHHTEKQARIARELANNQKREADSLRARDLQKQKQSALEKTLRAAPIQDMSEWKIGASERSAIDEYARRPFPYPGRDGDESELREYQTLQSAGAVGLGKSFPCYKPYLTARLERYCAEYMGSYGHTSCSFQLSADGEWMIVVESTSDSRRDTDSYYLFHLVTYTGGESRPVRYCHNGGREQSTDVSMRFAVLKPPTESAASTTAKTHSSTNNKPLTSTANRKAGASSALSHPHPPPPRLVIEFTHQKSNPNPNYPLQQILVH